MKGLLYNSKIDVRNVNKACFYSKHRLVAPWKKRNLISRRMAPVPSFSGKAYSRYVRFKAYDVTSESGFSLIVTLLSLLSSSDLLQSDPYACMFFMWKIVKIVKMQL